MAVESTDRPLALIDLHCHSRGSFDSLSYLGQRGYSSSLALGQPEEIDTFSGFNRSAEFTLFGDERAL